MDEKKLKVSVALAPDVIRQLKARAKQDDRSVSYLVQSFCLKCLALVKRRK